MAKIDRDLWEYNLATCALRCKQATTAESHEAEQLMNAHMKLMDCPPTLAAAPHYPNGSGAMCDMTLAALQLPLYPLLLRRAKVSKQDRSVMNMSVYGLLL
jgi:hypothetical protein